MYEAQISRSNPTAFVFLIDQSGSMDGDWPGEPGQKKAQALATILNRLLQNLVLRCAKEEGIREYYEIAVIGYGARVASALGGPLAGLDLVPVSRIGESPIRVEEITKHVSDGAGGLVDQRVKMPVWVDPQAENGTPMREAIGRAASILAPWVGAHPSAFPPIVMNLTDGEPTDGDPSDKTAELTSLSTSDGPVLLFNIHISSQAGAPTQFPADEAALPDDPARRLHRMSSVLPAFMQRYANSEYGLAAESSSRCYVFQSDAVAVIQALDIGTHPANMADVSQIG